MNNPVCPKCNSSNVAKIMYGYPAFDEEFEKEVAEGRVFLGGCCIEDKMPEYHCNACGKEFGKITFGIGK